MAKELAKCNGCGREVYDLDEADPYYKGPEEPPNWKPANMYCPDCGEATCPDCSAPGGECINCQ